ncbi:beta-lactam binding protein AmpH [Aquisphaera giovannonii]|uniref:Beta-lactam binding protein AmpH n=1 Tax=Aquisphaera giovannonii TaxID=406548 RepID=A0A5B9WBH2_9BACT|nr:beta-lactamase family protein [Aquisphaera giovannonii]QEH37614.1 beta-lactam binding protein AmpH [Aquisphaera giovannonii]
MLNAAKNQPLPQHAAGSCYSYSNFAWGLLGMCDLGIHSDDPNPDVTSAWVSAIERLLPAIGLRMPDTRPFPAIQASSLPAGFGTDGTILPEDTDYNPISVVLGGAGDVTSTGNDMYQWLAFHMGCVGYTPGEVDVQSVMQGTAYQATTTCGSSANPAVGLGWFFPAVAGGDKSYVSKDGGVTGYTSYMAFQRYVGESGDPTSSPTGVFVLANTRAHGGAVGLGRKLIQRLLGNSMPGAEYPDEGIIPSP